MVLIKNCVKLEDLQIRESQETQETQETQKTQETQEIQETQETQDLDDLNLQNLNEEEVKTLSKHVFKHFFNYSLYLAPHCIFPERNEEPNNVRLKSLTSEILNEKIEMLEQKLLN